MTKLPRRRAIVSVSDKTGLEEFVLGLQRLNYEIVSTGGTAKTLASAGIPVVTVSEITDFPEMLEGRVKTLHPVVHGGILADRTNPTHMDTIMAHGIVPIDLVCVNLYPFASTIAKSQVSFEEAVENIDIGGPAMIRSAVKNHASVTVVVHPSDYEALILAMETNNGMPTSQVRRVMAAKAIAHTAQYDAIISQWLWKQTSSNETSRAGFPSEVAFGFQKKQECRYGENPHQEAAFYTSSGVSEPCIANARQIHGKELSFNNIYDLNAALECAKEFTEEVLSAAVIIKHSNPCGVALGKTLSEAFHKARLGDPISAFGGILAVTRPLDVETADAITAKNTFFEAIIAPAYEAAAITILSERKKWGANLRLLETGTLENWRGKSQNSGWDFKRVVGGLLIQSPDHTVLAQNSLKIVTERKPSEEELQELLFAWRVVRHVKSNAIVFSRDRQVIGVGAGQMNRVQSVHLAVGQAQQLAQGAVMASDAFFPFPDGPEAAARAGITAIIQPGGSVKDEESIAVANRFGMTMVFTGFRHFYH